MASTQLTRTQSAGNPDVWTLSMWVKRSKLGGTHGLLGTGGGWQDGNGMAILFDSTDVLNVYNPSQGSPGGNYNKTTTKFRDTNGWFHLVFRADSTQASQADRMKIYVNGVQDTTLNTANLPSQNTDYHHMNQNGQTIIIGGASNANTNFCFDGVMAHVHLTDGYSYDANTFGETDSTTGIWKPKTNPSVTYGNNGFFLDFADSSDMGNDVSGNNNDFTVNGTLTQTIDTPSNVFATLNPLCKMPSDTTFSNGNTSIRMLGGDGANSLSTLGVSKGKYYWEAKLIGWNSTNSRHMIGINTGINSVTGTNQRIGQSADADSIGYSLYLNNVFQNGSEIVTGSNMGGSVANNDIYMFALDLDNYKFYIGRNGSWLNSGVPTSGSTGTGSIGTVANDKDYFVATTSNNVDGNNIHNNDWDFNFGNGYFGTTAVSSAGTNSGIGTFEYDVPSGFKALCTKNINAQEYS